MTEANPYRDCLCLTSRRLSRLLTQSYDEVLAAVGLRITQFSVLVALRTVGEEEVRLSVIADALDMDASTLSRILATLSRMGLVAIGRGADRRERVARLTEAGDAKLAEAMPHWQKAQETTFARIGDAGTDDMKTMLARLR